MHVGNLYLWYGNPKMWQWQCYNILSHIEISLFLRWSDVVQVVGVCIISLVVTYYSIIPDSNHSITTFKCILVEHYLPSFLSKDIVFYVIYVRLSILVFFLITFNLFLMKYVVLD